MKVFPQKGCVCKFSTFLFSSSEPFGLIIIKLRTIHPWVKAPDLNLFKWRTPFPKGGGFFFSKTTLPILSKLGTTHSLVIGMKLCSNEETYPFPTDNNSKNTLTTFKILLLQSHWAHFNQTYHNPWGHYKVHKTQSCLILKDIFS